MYTTFTQRKTTNTLHIKRINISNNKIQRKWKEKNINKNSYQKEKDSRKKMQAKKYLVNQLIGKRGKWDGVCQFLIVIFVTKYKQLQKS